MSKKRDNNRGKDKNKTNREEISGYRGMWMIAMFDLPVTEKDLRKEASDFRDFLKKLGFTMFQYSVYGKYFPSEEASKVYKQRLKEALPSCGQVRFLYITDKQFAKMEVFIARQRVDPEKPASQLILI